MGIANPVTRETHGSGTHYHLQLAKQLGDMLQAPLEVGVIYLFIYLLIFLFFFWGGVKQKERDTFYIYLLAFILFSS